MARHFLRHCSGSVYSCYSYSATIEKYSIWLGYNPELIIADTKPVGNIPDPQRVQNHCGYLDDYIAELQDEGLSPGRVHSLRKFFKTQMLALGVQPDYVDYMMGHTVDTYHDIQSLGIDKLRKVYTAAGLAIVQKTKVNKVDALKEIIRAWGMNPEQMLAKDALAEGATTKINPDELENHQIVVLSNQLKELIRNETR